MHETKERRLAAGRESQSSDTLPLLSLSPLRHGRTDFHWDRGLITIQTAASKFTRGDRRDNRDRDRPAGFDLAILLESIRLINGSR